MTIQQPQLLSTTPPLLINNRLFINNYYKIIYLLNLCADSPGRFKKKKKHNSSYGLVSMASRLKKAAGL